MAPSEKEIARFLRHEARLIDEKRLDEWLELFAEDAHYWVPASPGQPDPLNHNSLAYEDKLLLRLRVERLKSPRAYSQTPGEPLPACPAGAGLREARLRARRVPHPNAVSLHRDARRRIAALRRHRLAYPRLFGRDVAHRAQARRSPELRRRPALDPAFPVSAAIVTGGSAGIGRAVAERLLGAGYEVISLDVQPSALQVRHMSVDLTDEAATRQAGAEISKNYRVTTVIHNAGVIRPALLSDVKLEDLHALVNLHLGAAVTLTQACLPAMKAANYGRVVLVSSRAVLGLPTRTSYSATKAGMLGMARTWALELAPLGVTVNVVAPGPIETDNFYSVIPRGGAQAEKIAHAIPVRRLGQADDVARAVMFFADRDAGFVTGQVLYVCGGTSVGTLTL